MKRDKANHTALARRAERVHDRITEAAKAVQDALDREQLLREGQEARREDFARTYPSLRGR